MPQNTVLPDWRATYPIDAPAMKPAGVEVRKSVAISAAAWVTGVTTYTTAAHGLTVGTGAYVSIQGMTPTTFNYSGPVNVASATTVTVGVTPTPGTATAFGTMYYMNLSSTAIPNSPLMATTKPMSVGSEEYNKMMLGDKEKAKPADEEETEEESGEEAEEEDEEEVEEEDEPTPPRRTPPRRR